MAIKNKLPHLAEVYPVYAIIVILTYGWTIYWALWKLPSWLDFLPLSEIGAIFCYLMATNFIESLLVLFGVLIISLILPRKWFRDLFVSRGSMLAASVLISLMIFEYHFDKPADYFNKFPLYLPLILVIAGVLAFLAGWIGIVRKAVEVFAENAVIFIFISLPISLLSLIVVIARNLF
ncbi:MAG: hypothetical protein WBW94_03720 [Anaerolineales bacterium]